MSIRRILFVIFILTNSMNILAFRASRRRRRRDVAAAAILEHQFIKNKCLIIQTHYQIENNTCPATTSFIGSPNFDFYNKFCDIDYVPKRAHYSVFNAMVVLFCVIGVISSNPVYPLIKTYTPIYDRP